MPSPQHPLTKSRDKIVSGVCGGVAQWLGVDFTIVRVVFVVFLLMTGLFPGVLIYLLLMLIMPDAV